MTSDISTGLESIHLVSQYFSEKEDSSFEMAAEILEAASSKGAFFPGRRGDTAKIVRVEIPAPFLRAKETPEWRQEYLEWTRLTFYFTVVRSWGIYSPYQGVDQQQHLYSHDVFVDNVFVDKILIGKSEMQICTLLTLAGFRPYKFQGQDIFIQEALKQTEFKSSFLFLLF